MMSGFLMAYQYLQKPVEATFGFRFAWSKVRSLYPLHIVTMVAMLPFAVVNVLKGALSLVTLFAAVVLNVGMLLTWVPWGAMHTALNNPSWFMCTIVFAYLCFPLVLRKLKALRNMSGALSFIGCFVAAYAAAGIAVYIFVVNGAGREAVKSCVYFSLR